ncbi:hypothetical protein [Xanthomonas axonopodis]|uniref:hypothetical protein n=1 Tax=Xanthomonas axonopodis TaxID=53413 RepID=UPI000EFFB212|nr:hypothetical protein [Xanthomonas axonopodis]AYO95605.1 hypothetical protein Xcom_11860 [Xanthomonas axonopodis pv. commiphoreae]
MTDPYREFLERKVRVAPSLGFDVSPDEVHPILKPHQRDSVVWALSGGRRALFQRFGLGKSMQQLEIMRLARAHAGGAVGIVDRLIQRFSNAGELVFDPFGGLFTVPYRALKLGRQGRAAELSTSYFMDGVRYLLAAEREMAMPDLFATLEPHQQDRAA